MHLEDEEDEVVPAAGGGGMLQSSSFTKSFVMEQTVDGGNGRGKTGTNMSYRLD